jgi:hypothetical protein
LKKALPGDQIIAINSRFFIAKTISMRKNIFIISMLLILSAQIAQAAPAPRGLALNLEKKECAGYWAGDEFVAYRLPEGWKAYLPAYDQSGGKMWGKIKTEAGECGFQAQKEEACCMELGLAYVSDNIGKGRTEKLRDQEEFEKNLAKHDRTRSAYVFGSIIFLTVLALGAALFFLGRRMEKKDGL